ncbi:hypothetical protein N7478_008566 [Penicillium angulare]|uniref:uncharacterized protein n=1 Tax=Penicillium angulare TaxID=116970 RepID=UPI002541D0E0|nr:uncharacterized protein N7478_008566 [Penicillium angulare]KAJ5273441.1 hypothetical protein N7478_008566 [Penicillium angulare]
MSETSESEIPLDSVNRGDRHGKDKSSSNKSDASIPDDNQGNNSSIIPTHLDSAIAGEPHALYHFIREQAQLPPQIGLHIKGYGFKEGGETVLNFYINLTYSVIRINHEDREWNELKVVRDGDGVGAYRGSGSLTLQWKPGRRFRVSHKKQNLKNGVEEYEGQSLLGINEDTSNGADLALMTWCERFCRDPAGMKEFKLRRLLQGFDSSTLRAEVLHYLHSIVRGDQSIKRVTADCQISSSVFTVRSPHWLNDLEDSKLFCTLIILTQLWILYLPFMHFFQGNYEVVSSCWNTSKVIRDEERPCGFSKLYARGRDESKLVAFWAPAIVQAIKDRENNGRTLTLGYLEGLEERNRDRAAYGGRHQS